MRKQILEEAPPPVADPHTEVEMTYIAEYLKSKGFSAKKLAELPAADAKKLLEEASQFASLHLAKMEMGAAFVGALHHDATAKTVAAVSSVAES